MPLNLPVEVWSLFAFAGLFFVAPFVLIYIAHRLSR